MTTTLPHALPQICSLLQRTCFVVLALMSFSLVARAQVSTTSGKTPAGVAAGAPAGSYNLTGFENVNLYSGNLNFSLPLLKIGGRGSASTSINLTVNSIRWQMERVDEWTGTQSGAGGGPRPKFQRDEGHYFSPIEINVLDWGQFFLDQWIRDPRGLPPDYFPGNLTQPFYGNYIPPPPPDLSPMTNAGGGGGISYMMPTPAQWGGLRAGYGPGVLQGRWMGKGHGSPYSSHTTLLRFTFTAADGTEYELRDTEHGGAPVTASGLYNINRKKTFKSADGISVIFISDQDVMEPYASRIELYVYPTGYLLMADGSRYRVEEGLVKWIRDRHGNMLFFTYGTNINDDKSYNKVIKIKDSLGREVDIAYDIVPQASAPHITFDEIRFRSFGGSSYQYIKIWKDKLENTLRSDSTLKSYQQLFPGGTGDAAGVLYNPGGVVSAVELPDGRRYHMRYNSYGEMARVVLPTGGAIEYDYNLFEPQGQTWSGLFDGMTIYRRVSRRRVYASGTGAPESIQYYKPRYSGDGSATNEWKTDVVVEQRDLRNGGDVLVSFEKHYFYGYPVVALAPRQGSPNYFYPDWKEGKEYKAETFEVVNGVATVPLKSVENVWDKRADIPWAWTGPAHTAPAVDPRIIATKTRLLDSAQMMMQEISYSNENTITSSRPESSVTVCRAS